MQIRHTGSASHLILQGLTFYRSSQYAVVAEGGPDSVVEFVDCELSVSMHCMEYPGFGFLAELCCVGLVGSAPLFIPFSRRVLKLLVCS